MAVVPFPDPQSSKDLSEHDESDRWSNDSDEIAGGKMSFLDHLDELRKRLIYSLVSLGVGVGIACLFIERIYNCAGADAADAAGRRKAHHTEAPEAFMLYIRIAIIAGWTPPRSS
jgi:sec-independent protein translocase protein TatC